MPLVSLKEITKYAISEKYAVAASEFDTGYVETKRHIEWFKTKPVILPMANMPY